MSLQTAKAFSLSVVRYKSLAAAKVTSTQLKTNTRRKRMPAILVKSFTVATKRLPVLAVTAALSVKALKCHRNPSMLDDKPAGKHLLLIVQHVHGINTRSQLFQRQASFAAKRNRFVQLCALQV